MELLTTIIGLIPKILGVIVFLTIVGVMAATGTLDNAILGLIEIVLLVPKMIIFVLTHIDDAWRMVSGGSASGSSPPPTT